MPRPPAILVLDDEVRILEEIREFLESRGREAVVAERPSAAFRAIEGRDIGIALVDMKLPEYDGLEFIRRLKAARPEVEPIAMSGHGDMESVIAAFRLGAFDYLRKPFTTVELELALGRTARFMDAAGESKRYAGMMAELNRELAGGEGLLGDSQAMGKVREMIALAAANPDSPVLIRGESGTGKELAARQIHALGARASGRFVAVNCAAVPREVFESEFFGHARGAFTDAKGPREGLFRSAHKGTLFLDEVGELPLELQAKLLRAIEEKAVRPVGADEERESDARVICATNRDLAALSSSGAFRRDLYYRLAVLEIDLPPLRERKEDIPALARCFLERRGLAEPVIERICDGDFMAALGGYDFPGNARELKNFMERAAILGRRPSAEELAAWFGRIREPARRPDGGDKDFSLARLERDAVLRAMDEAKGVQAVAARLLGISRQSLERKLAKIKANPGYR
jgi:DNA-binding NtrC family response regulator